MGVARLFLVAAAFCVGGLIAYVSVREGVASPIQVDQTSYAFLKSLPREWAGGSKVDCKTYEDKNVDRLDPAFAASAARFLQAFVATHGNVTLTSAHRNASEQACVCIGEKGPCAGRTRYIKTKKGRRIAKKGGPSRHQTGIALDVRAGLGTNEEFKCLHEFAKLNPQFGVSFPLGMRDRPHMEQTRGVVASKGVKVATIGPLPPAVVPCTSMKVMLVNGSAD